MRLETQDSRPIDDPDDRQIEAAVRGMTGDDSFAILAYDVMHYMQAAGTVAEGFTLEYQSGGTDRHFVAADGPHTADRVAKAFRLYNVGDLRWQSDFEWEPMDV